MLLRRSSVHGAVEAGAGINPSRQLHERGVAGSRCYSLVLATAILVLTQQRVGRKYRRRVYEVQISC